MLPVLTILSNSREKNKNAKNAKKHLGASYYYKKKQNRVKTQKTEKYKNIKNVKNKKKHKNAKQIAQAFSTCLDNK